MSHIVEVFHKNHDSDTAVHVANVSVPEGTEATDALEFAYRWTQNIQDSWSMKGKEDGNTAVEIIAPLHVIDEKTYGLRSTMMFDKMVYLGKTYEVATFGFTELEV